MDNKKKNIMDIVATMRDSDDDLGSYTGTPDDTDGQPTQDADDL